MNVTPAAAEEPHRKEMPAARVRMAPIMLGGTALWLGAFIVVLVGDYDTLARDVTVGGVSLGLIGSLWARYFDRRPPRS